MSQFSTFIANLEAKIKQYETQVQQSIMNHNALLGALQSTKEALVEAHTLVNAVAPDSSLDETLNVVEEVANLIPIPAE